MSKFFNGRETELLAPAGTFEDFKTLVNTGADAFYLGGKKFNMRVHRADYNFSNEEIEKAIEMAHEKGKKIYITFNNMMSNDELKECEEFLRFLEKAQPDALIIQDFGAVKLIRDLGLNLNIHLSVMANVHNLAMVNLAKTLGVTRIVTSRELSLNQIKTFVDKVPEMEYEYFIHGDMCSVHGSQCLYSGMLFGKSSNRGLCMKPCRWPFKAEGEGNKVHPLGVKDMSLYRHIPELIISGVNSFKIEGRMRGSEYLTSIINLYREAIDRFIEDPTAYYIDKKSSEFLFENRVRNISTAYALKKPGAHNIDIKGDREPRIFSNPVEEFSIKDERIQEVKEILEGENTSNHKMNLAVKVNNLEAFKAACDGGADLIYISGEVFKPCRPFSKEEIKAAVEYAKGKRVYYVMPKMTYDEDLLKLKHIIDYLKNVGVTGIVTGNAGEIYEFNQSGLEVRGDSSLNTYNYINGDFYKELGLTSVTLSLEATAKVTKDMVKDSSVAVEIVGQGAPAVMYLEHCLMAAEHGETSDDFCRDYCNKSYNLTDINGIAHRVYGDSHCRNHIIPTKDICYLPFIKELKNLGVNTFRIEGQHYNEEEIKEVVKLYRTVIDNVDNYTAWKEDVDKLLKITGREQSIQALNY
jgi:putative protease